MHCGDESGDVAAFGFGAGEGVVGRPSVPVWCELMWGVVEGDGEGGIDWDV